MGRWKVLGTAVLCISLWGCSPDEYGALRGTDGSLQLAESGESARSLQSGEAAWSAAFGPPGTGECPTGFKKIKNLKDCKAAAGKMGKNFHKQVKWKRDLPGCFSAGGDVLYNKARKGQVKLHQRLLCMDPTGTAPPGPTTTSTQRGSICASGMKSVRLNFANIVANNLGGQGPNFGDDPSLRYEAVGEVNGTFFDVKVTASPEYTVPSWNRNGLSGTVPGSPLPAVSIKTNSMVDLKFTIVRHGTDDPMELDTFYIDIFDIDEGPFATEEISVSGYADIKFPDNYQYNVEDTDDGKKITSTVFGEGCDNPTNSTQLLALECDGNFVNQTEKMFTMRFEQKDGFDLQFKAPFQPGETKTNGGRVLLLAGEACTPHFGFTDECFYWSKLYDEATQKYADIVNETVMASERCEEDGACVVRVNRCGLTCDDVVTDSTVCYCAYDDDDFTGELMCKDCGGGLHLQQTTTGFSSAGCDSNPCEQEKLFDFTNEPTVNNLGGFGPQTPLPGEEPLAKEIRYSKIGTTSDGVDFDLCVMLTDETTYKAPKEAGQTHVLEENGITEKPSWFDSRFADKTFDPLGAITVGNGAKANLKFVFVETGTDKKVELSNFKIKVYDVDYGLRSDEVLTVGGYDDDRTFDFPDGHTFQVEKDFSGSPLSVSSTGGGHCPPGEVPPSGEGCNAHGDYGEVCDNPWDPRMLEVVDPCGGVPNSVDQVKKHFTMSFKDKADFDIAFEAKLRPEFQARLDRMPQKKREKHQFPGGRVFLFSGVYEFCHDPDAVAHHGAYVHDCPYDGSYGYCGYSDDDGSYGYSGYDDSFDDSFGYSGYSDGDDSSSYSGYSDSGDDDGDYDYYR